MQHDVLVTGGEDSKIITWRIETSSFADSLTLDQSDEPMEPEGPNVNLKRDMDVIMGVRGLGSVSKQLCRDKISIDYHFQDGKRMRR